MAGPILLDSTVFVRLILGEPGADFVVNLFNRAEQGGETLILPSTAVLEAISAALVAEASAVAERKDYEEAVKTLHNLEYRHGIYDKVMQLVAYIEQMVNRGRFIVYSVTVEDVLNAAKRAVIEGFTLHDALTLTIANKLKIQRIASFSKHLRVGLSDYVILPQIPP